MFISRLIVSLSFSTFFCILLAVGQIAVTHIEPREHNYCEYYNKTCTSSGKRGCNGIQECTSLMDGKQRPCYVLWSLDDNNPVNVALKGCYLDMPDCIQSKCVSRRHNPKNKILFCCCTGNLCNVHFS